MIQEPSRVENGILIIDLNIANARRINGNNSFVVYDWSWPEERRISWRNPPSGLFTIRHTELDDYIEDINNITETERSLLLLNESIELIN